ncbi:MAG: ATP-dependent Clp protease adaptor ClpS [Planctomycetota bacterium]
MATEYETSQESRTERSRPRIVVLYNDDVHAFEEVVLQVQRATGKSLAEATHVTLIAHTRGKSVVFTGTLDECQRVAGILRRIRLQVEVDEA